MGRTRQVNLLMCQWVNVPIGQCANVPMEESQDRDLVTHNCVSSDLPLHVSRFTLHDFCSEAAGDKIFRQDGFDIENDGGGLGGGLLEIDGFELVVGNGEDYCLITGEERGGTGGR